MIDSSFAFPTFKKVGNLVRERVIVPLAMSWQEGRALIRSRKENPLAVYNGPVRTLSRRAVFVGFVGLTAFGLGYAGQELFSQEPLLVAYGYWTFSLLAVPVLGFFAFLFFRYRYREPAHLDELRMTLIAPREVAFGAIWWPVAVSFLWFVPLFLAQCVAEIVALGEDETVLGSVGRLGVLVLAWALAAGIQVQAWLRETRGGFLRPLIVGAVRYAAVGILTVPTVVLLTEMAVEIPGVWELGLRQEPLMWMIALVVCPILVGVYVRRSLRFAGAAFFAPVDPEGLACLEWGANESLARKEKEKSRGSLRRLVGAVRPGIRADRRALAITVLMLVLGAIAGYVLYPWDSWTGAVRGVFGFNAVLAAFLYCSVLTVIFRTRWRDDRPLPLLTGSTLGSILPYLVFAVSMMGLLGLVGVGLDTVNLETGLTEMIFLWAGGGIIWLVGLLGAILAVLALLPRGRRKWIAGLLLLYAVLLHFLPLYDMSQYYRVSYFFLEPGEPGAFVLAFSGVAFVWALLLGLPALAQRLHEREFRGRPRHQITTGLAAEEKAVGAS